MDVPLFFVAFVGELEDDTRYVELTSRKWFLHV
jgi:hypothetical protein